MMPHMSGFEVCKKIRSTPAVKTLPIMILTARIQEHDREAAFESGATDYMTKPITSRQLTARVERLLSQDSSPEAEQSPSPQAS